MPLTGNRRARRLISVVSFIAVLLLWEFATWEFHVRPVILPAPSDIIHELRQDVLWYLSNAGHTLLTTLVAFVLSVIIGVTIAVSLVNLPWFESAIYPLIVSFNSVPKVAVAPLFIVWLGTGMESQVAIAFLIAVFAIIVETVHGLRSVPRDIVDLGRILRGSAVALFMKISLPCALPYILSGMKVSISLALVGAIVGEFVASQRGLGYIILSAQGSFDTARAFAALSLLAAMGMILYSIIEWLDRRVVHWR
ncbi:ABC transporter permease [Tardiphaga sp. 866_E4_N2_1]|uniref:ABC transporter permease n=1 Tax=unclassified Tardiphaga TaxID=2631404 RepID=UPI003F21866E